MESIDPIQHSPHIPNPVVSTKADTYEQDAECPFLFQKITPSGRASWVFMKTWQRRSIKLKIGDTAALSAMEARLEALKMLRELQNGKDPVRRINESRKPELSVGDLFELYFTQHVEPRASRPQDVRGAFDRHWKPIGKIVVAGMTTNDVQKWLNKIGEKSTSVANRQLNQLRACVNYGINQGLVTLSLNPCASVTAFPIEDRERYLMPDEYPRLMKVLRDHPSDVSDAIELLLWTAARKSNVISMEWSELDFKSKLWVVPAWKSKTRKPLRISLTKAAINVLNRRRKHQFTSRWVFPTSSAVGHIVNIDRSWREIIREKAKLGNMHLHDLRHTMASWMGMAGENAFVIQRALTHASVRTTQRYVELDQSTVCDALERSQDRLEG